MHDHFLQTDARIMNTHQVKWHGTWKSATGINMHGTI
jgi:hypothetical protein